MNDMVDWERGIEIHDSSYVDDMDCLGDNTKVWHFTHIDEGVKIGKNCSIGQNCYIAKGVNIGNNVKIQNNVSIYNGVSIGNYVFIGPSVVFTNVKNPRANISQKDNYQKTMIGDYVTIGANSTIICEHYIDDYAFIGAGCVVSKDIRPFELVIGNPMKVVGIVDKDGTKYIHKSGE